MLCMIPKESEINDNILRIFILQDTLFQDFSSQNKITCWKLKYLNI